MTRRGAENPNWRGGRIVTQHGYVLVRVGTEHPLADVRGYAYEHRVVAEQKIGRPLEEGEQVHHINGDRQDNRPENLEVKATIRQHRYEHREANSRRRKPKEPNPFVECECGCGATFPRYDRGGRPRRFVSGHNTILQYKGKSHGCTEIKNQLD